MGKPSVLSQLGSILVLPFNVIITIPIILILLESKTVFSFDSLSVLHALAFFPAVIFIIIGFILLVHTVRLFINVGEGTLAPWDPTEKLVVEGPYKYVRNPMISGAVLILIGEALVFWSVYILVWLVLFVLINTVYFIFVEEPGLVKRFGNDYKTYKNNVPRWIPRLQPWKNEN